MAGLGAARVAAWRPAVIALAAAIGLLLPGPAWARKPAPQPAPSPEAALAFLHGQIGPSGLIDSYVEDNIDYSYTYDDAVAVIAFISARDLGAAAAILDAFALIGPESEGGFLHRYRASDGRPDGTLYAGPNAYLLQAMNLYYLATGDPTYNALAKGIADFLLSLQDVDGGIFGRRDVGWKSTENNLGALAALHNFGRLHGLLDYVGRADALRLFLEAECWDQIRFLRGKNDPTIVTDVQALGVLVLGPLFANGAYWVEDHTLTTRRYSGSKTVTGFDMNADRDTVWTEGTLQQALAFWLAGDPSRSSGYRAEAEKLFQPSGALWQASNTGSTGDGWNLQRWQAVAPTAWYVYVSLQDNVLELLP